MSSADYSVLIPERVSLEYGIAGVGSRGGASIVDTTIQLVALVVLGLGLVGLTALSGGTVAGSVILALAVLGLFVVSSGYYILFEILWNGQTPGKRLVGLRVIRESGYPLRPVDAAIRNVVRIVDWLPIGYGIGVLVMLLNSRAKRLGDFAAGTIVVREGSFRPITISGETPAKSFTLSAADATLVRDFLIRRASMDSQARSQLAHRLAVALSQRYAIPIDDQDPEALLERLTL